MHLINVVMSFNKLLGKGGCCISAFFSPSPNSSSYSGSELFAQLVTWEVLGTGPVPFNKNFTAAKDGPCSVTV